MRQKTETKRKKTKKRNAPKHHQKVIAQPDVPEVQAERDGDEEAAVEQDLPKSLDHLREKCLAPRPLEDIKRKRRKTETKNEAEMKGNDPQAKRKRVRTRKRTGNENPRVTRM